MIALGPATIAGVIAPVLSILIAGGANGFDHALPGPAASPKALDRVSNLYRGAIKSARHRGSVGNVDKRGIEVTAEVAREPLEFRLVARRKSRGASDSLELLSYYTNFDERSFFTL
jgi:hypothetical protein